MSNLWVIPEELGDLADSEYAYEACKSASYLLWGLSGRKFSGLTQVTELYRHVPESVDSNRIFEVPTRGHLVWDYLTHLPRRESTIRLKGHPVIGVDLVRFGRERETMDPANYYLTDHSLLNFVTPILDQDIEVTYRYGSQPPTAGRMAARTLAQQFALLWSGSDECELPARVTSVARQGVTFTILDQQDFIADLRTGVYAVDLFLKTVNPDGARRKSRVFSPDIPRGQRYTPKPPVLGASALDIGSSETHGSGSITVPLSSIQATFLTDGTGWVPEVILYNSSGKKSTTLTYGIVIDSGNITVTILYSDAMSVLGPVDPGSWSLYGVKNGVSTYIASGNLSLILGSN